MPNRGWMTLRWMPIWPSPASTATGLCATTQVLPGQAPISIGKPAPGCSARTPWSRSAVAMRSPTSVTASSARWNSRLPTERAGERIASTAVRFTNATRARGRGNAAVMSAI